MLEKAFSLVSILTTTKSFLLLASSGVVSGKGKGPLCCPEPPSSAYLPVGVVAPAPLPGPAVSLAPDPAQDKAPGPAAPRAPRHAGP